MNIVKLYNNSDLNFGVDSILTVLRDVLAFSLPICTKKTKNTVLGYKKGSKLDVDMFFDLATIELYRLIFVEIR